MQSIFHMAFNVTNLAVAEKFYTYYLGCTPGRKTETWADYDFFGHQLSLHLGEPFKVQCTGLVDNIAVPIPHFGVVIALPQWRELAESLAGKNMDFVVMPSVRFEGEKAEQYTMFFYDPFGNPIELKGFSNLEMVIN